MTALGALLAWIAGWQEFQRRQSAQYFAILQTGTGKPLFLLRINVIVRDSADLEAQMGGQELLGLLVSAKETTRGHADSAIAMAD